MLGTVLSDLLGDWFWFSVLVTFIIKGEDLTLFIQQPTP